MSTKETAQQVIAVELHCQAMRGLPTGLLADVGRAMAKVDPPTDCPCPNCRHHRASGG